VQYPSGGTGMFKEGDIRAYDAERDAKRARQPRRAKAAGPRAASRSRYALDPAVIAAGKLPDKAPIVTSAANPHYQKRFDELHKLAAAGDWAAVRDYKVSGSNSYSKLVARYQQDLLALHAAWEAAKSANTSPPSTRARARARGGSEKMGLDDASVGGRGRRTDRGPRQGARRPAARHRRNPRDGRCGLERGAEAGVLPGRYRPGVSLGRFE